MDIDADIQNDSAHLSGAGESDIDRELAGEITSSVSGVTKIEHELAVNETKAAMTKDGETASARQGFKQIVMDATLTARTMLQLLSNGNTGGMAIRVEAKRGDVALSGVARSDEERSRDQAGIENRCCLLCRWSTRCRAKPGGSQTDLSIDNSGFRRTSME